MLATAVSDKPFEWEQHLRRLCFAYNTSIHPTTGFSPFSLMFGRQARMPVDIALETANAPACTVPEYVANLRTSLDAAYTHVRNQMGHRLEQQKIRYDAKTCGKPFEAGDLVWLHNPAIPCGRSKNSIDHGLDHTGLSQDCLRLCIVFSILSAAVRGLSSMSTD